MAPGEGEGEGATTKKKKKASAAYTDNFLEWYRTYPRHVRKKEAATAYDRAIKRITVERGIESDEAHGVLMEMVQIFADSDKGRGDFCPHPTTWLNGGSWDDDPNDWNRGAVKAPSSEPAF